MKVLALAGSLRKESFTKKLVRAFKQHAPQNIEVTIFDLKDIPLYNEDHEQNPPKAVKDLQNALHNADAVLVATPEYNRSYSPVIKNAIDWASRPLQNQPWRNKPTAIVGATPHEMGTLGAQHHLRHVFTYLNAPVVMKPEFYLSNVNDKFNEAGDITDEHTIEKINEMWHALEALAERYK